MGAVKAIYSQIEGILTGEPFDGDITYIMIRGTSPSHSLIAVGTIDVIKTFAAGLTNSPIDDIDILDFPDGSAVIQRRGITLTDYTLLLVE